MIDPGYFMLGKHKFRDSHPQGRGAVNMALALAVSSDTYFYSLAHDMGIERLSQFIGKFGFGALTGIDLPGEKAGILPSPAWKEKRFTKPAQQIWYAGDTVSVGVGQGYNTYTPLQMAHETAILANNGVVLRPHIVQSIEDPKTGVKRSINVKPIKRLALNPANLAVVKQGMVNVVRFGTGAAAFAGAAYQAAGKTGTAQVIPKIALAVIVENGGWGASTAAPIARKVLDYYLLGRIPQSVLNDSDAVQADE